MLEFYYIIHYIVYSFYRKHGEDKSTAIFSACCFHGTLFTVFVIELIGLCNKYTIFHIGNISKEGVCVISLLILSIEYFAFFRRKRYLGFFAEYDNLRDTEQISKKIKWAKVYNICIVFFEIMILFMIDYINQHNS